MQKPPGWDGSWPVGSSSLLLQFAHNCMHSVRRSSYGTNALFWRAILKTSSWERVQGQTAAAASAFKLEGMAGGNGAMQQQHSNEKLNFKLIRECMPEERANHNYQLLYHRKDLSVIAGSTENISSVIGTTGTGEKETTRVKPFCKSKRHVSLAPTSQKMLAMQLEKAHGRIWMVWR